MVVKIGHALERRASGLNPSAYGDDVRYFGRTYRCRQAHSKSLLRAPTNGTYWEVIAT